MIVSIFGEEQQVEQGMTLYDIVKQQSRQEDYVLAYQNGRLCELYKTVEEGADIQFVSTKDPLGMLAYKRSMSLLMLKAFYEHYKKEKTRVVIKHSINQAYFCVIQGKPIEEVQKVLPQIEKKMREMVEKALPIRKQTIRTSEAIKRFHEYGMFAKEKLFRYRRGSRMNLYELDGYEEYFYGY
ncbi:MAG: nucleoside kinase, partial [Firmicutes bacterium]|nr:nucleoside kinase [Candidatus Scybalomonas excrementavium]